MAREAGGVDKRRLNAAFCSRQSVFYAFSLNSRSLNETDRLKQISSSKRRCPKCGKHVKSLFEGSWRVESICHRVIYRGFN